MGQFPQRRHKGNECRTWLYRNQPLSLYYSSAGIYSAPASHSQWWNTCFSSGWILTRRRPWVGVGLVEEKRWKFFLPSFVIFGGFLRFRYAWTIHHGTGVGCSGKLLYGGVWWQCLTPTHPFGTTAMCFDTHQGRVGLIVFLLLIKWNCHIIWCNR